MRLFVFCIAVAAGVSAHSTPTPAPRHVAQKRAFISVSANQPSSLQPPSLQTGLPKTQSISIAAKPPAGAGPAVSSAFFGYSFEYSDFGLYFGQSVAGLRQGLVNHINGLTKRAKQEGMLIRVAGSSQDGTSYSSSQTVAMDVESANVYHGYGVSTTGPETFRIMKEVNRQTGATFGIGLNLANFTGSGMVQMTKAIDSILGDGLDAVEPGNEVDLFSRYVRPEDCAQPVTRQLTRADSQQDYFADMAAAIKQISPIIGKKVGGPNYGGKWPWHSIYDGGYLDAFKTSTSRVRLHYYPSNKSVPRSEIRDG